MTISTTSNTTIAQGNGLTTSFDFGFPVPLASELFVYYTNSNGAQVQLTPSQYTATGIGTANGGSVTYPIGGAPIATGTSITIQRVVPYVQVTDLVNQSGYYPNVVENALDYLTMQTQQLAQGEQLTLQVPLESTQADILLPTASQRANTVLGFNASGGVEVLPIPSSVGAGDLRVEEWVDGVDYTSGTSTSVTLSRAYTSKANLGSVVMQGVAQDPASYSLNGNALIFNAIIPVGASKIWCTGGTTLSLSQPAQGSVTDDSIAVGSTLYNLFFGNVHRFGAKGDGVTDDTSAVQAALTAVAAAGGGTVYIPKGTYILNGNLTYTQPAADSALVVVGEGSELTKLKWVAAGGLVINHSTADQSLQIRDMSFLTATNGTATAISMVMTSPGIPAPGINAINLMKNLTFRGADGFSVVNFWNFCIEVNGCSNVNFEDINCCANLAFYTSGGVGVYLHGTTTLIPVVFNFVACSFNHIGCGILYGANVQGVTVTACNMTGNAIGIGTSPGLVDGSLVQLSVLNSQFNCVTAINMPSEIQDVQVANCEFLIPQNGIAISSDKTYNLSLCNNHFNPSLFGLTNTNGVVIDNTAANSGAVITGNIFWNLINGVTLTANSHAVSVQSNLYLLCTNNVNNAGTGNIIGGGTP